jgi:hypothetical protein
VVSIFRRSDRDMVSVLDRLARSRWVRGLLLGVVWLMIWLSWPARAWAERPVIPPGREPELLALFQPYALGDELAPGWTLHSMNIDKATVILWIAGPQPASPGGPRALGGGEAQKQAYAEVRLDHIDYGPPGAERLPSFAWSVVESPPGCEPALASLRERIAVNDDGRFWAAAPVADGGVVEDVRARRTMAWSSDGLLLGLVFALALAALLRDTLRDVEPWLRWALLGVVLVGVLLRLTLPVRVSMDPWSYTRVLVVAQLVYGGPLLAVLHPEPVYLTELLHGTSLVLSMLAPLTIYPHARSVLLDSRAALVTAALLAVLPMHLRFSASDTGFMPMITLASMAFALTYAALHEPRRAWAALMFALIPVLVALLFLLRPLDAIYVPLLLGLPFIAQGMHEDRPRPAGVRIALLGLLLLGVTLAVGAPHLLGKHGHDIDAGLDVETLRSALGVLFDVRFNALLNPSITPPGLLLLALLGGWDLARRRRLRLLGYLLVWMVSFLVVSAYVVPREPLMQARYHLHLVTPFLLLAAVGVDATLRALAKLGRTRGRVLAGIVAAYLAASPLLHVRFIRDVEFNEMREWMFVHDLRDEIEPGCVVLEHTGMGTDSRMERVGAYIEAGVPRQRFTHVSLARDDEGQYLSDEALAMLTEPPECLYLLHSLPCYSAKRDEQPIAPVCHDALGYLQHQQHVRMVFESRVYDENLGAHLGNVQWVELGLFQLRRKPE